MGKLNLVKTKGGVERVVYDVPEAGAMVSPQI
jgi:hypothetical protein